MTRKLIGSAITNKEGIATITYTGTGTDEVNIVAVCGNLTSNVFTIMDNACSEQIEEGTSVLCIKCKFDLNQVYEMTDEFYDYLSQLNFKVTGYDSRMPLNITYAQFTDGRFKLSDVETGTYTVQCTNYYDLPEGLMLIDSINERTLEIGPDTETTFALIFAYETEEPEPIDETVDIPVTITWYDNDNSDGNCPDNVTIHLYAGGSEVNTVTITDDWQ